MTVIWKGDGLKVDVRSLLVIGLVQRQLHAQSPGRDVRRKQVFFSKAQLDTLGEKCTIWWVFPGFGIPGYTHDKAAETPVNVQFYFHLFKFSSNSHLHK